MDAKKAINKPFAPISSRMRLSLTINGEAKTIDTVPTARLVDILRDSLHLTGTKRACDIGRCGACSVMMNGALVNACLVMAYQASEACIQTVEGEDFSFIQEAFLSEGGFQCGYCTPGMVMAVKALLNTTSLPTEEQIQEALSGNICRCTGYAGIIRAVRRAAAAKMILDEYSIEESL